MRIAAGASLFVLLISVLTTSQQNRVVPEQERPPNDPRAFAAGNLQVGWNSPARFEIAKGRLAPLVNQSGLFFQAPQYSAGSAPTSMTAGDFNGDGHMDLAVVNACGSSPCVGFVSVLLGNSDGTFQAPQAYPSGSGPFALPAIIAVGDFNGDNKVDLVVANDGGASVSVLLGNGDGTFQPYVDYATGTGPESVAVGDFNGDGKLDLAVAHSCFLLDSIQSSLSCGGNGAVSVLLGNGDGTFQPYVDYATGGGFFGPASAAVGDFNGDGRLDLVVGNYYHPSSVGVMLGNGDGTFKAPVTYPVANDLPVLHTLAVADLNGDGKMDVVAAPYVFLGNGDGTLQPPYDSGASGGAVAVADLNGDGYLDLAASNGAVVSVLFGNGDGTFQPSVDYTTGAGAGADGVVVWDFSNDRRPDLAVLNRFGTVGVLFGNGDGTFQASRNYEGQAHFSSVAVGDFNGDGKPDLVADDGGADVAVLLGIGDGTFQPLVNYGPGAGSDSVAVGDFNLDGKPDLVTAGGGSVSVFLGNGNGTFQSFVDYKTGATGGGLSWQSVAVGDFNGDGKPDLVVVPGYGVNGGTSGIEVLLGNGDGTFQSSTAYQVRSNPMSVAVGDFNGDGKLDLAVANLCSLVAFDPFDPVFCDGSGSVGVLLGHGDGTFGEEVIYGGVGDFPVSVAVGDFNGDGKLDLVLSDGGNLYILLGAGDGSFGASQSYGSGASAEPGDAGVPFRQSVVVADFKGDGKPDLAVSNFGGPLAVLLGNGDGTFQASQNYAAGSASQSLAVGDFNGDGALDLVTEGLFVLLNRHGTLISVQSSSNPSIVGQTVEFTVTVAAGVRGTGSPTGTVTVKCGASVLGSGALVSGRFVVSTSSLGEGSHRISATYSGDHNFQKHTSETLIQKVQKIPTGTELNSSPNPSNFNEPVTFTSTVTPDAGTKPSGSVTFWDGATMLGTGSLNTSGSASVSISTLTAGRHNVTSSYSGDGNFTASMSAAVSQVVNDFQNTVSTPTPASVVPGQSATATVTVGPLGGFNIPISLTCSVSPMPALAPTCALDPTSVTPVAGKSTSSTLTIKTTASSSASLTTPSPQRDSRLLYVLWLPIAGLLLFRVASPSYPSRRRKLLGFLAGAALMSGLLFQLACGAGMRATTVAAGTPAGSYMVTVTATSGSMAHTTTVTLKVAVSTGRRELFGDL